MSKDKRKRGYAPTQAEPRREASTMARATGCAVSDLIPTLQVYFAQAERAAERGDSEREVDHLDALDTLSNNIAEMRAASVAGAALQLMLAMERAEMIRGCYTQEDRDHHHDRFEALMRSALGVLGASMPDDLWFAYLGGDRPTPPATVAPDDGAKFLAWEAELDRALGNMDWDADARVTSALALQRQILTTPGKGAIVAQVKLRALLHPEIGIEAGAGDHDADALRTALAALT